MEDRRSILRLIAALIGTTIGLVGRRTRHQDDTVYFGVSGPVTGDNAEYARLWRQGFELELEDISSTAAFDGERWLWTGKTANRIPGTQSTSHNGSSMGVLAVHFLKWQHHHSHEEIVVSRHAINQPRRIVPSKPPEVQESSAPVQPIATLAVSIFPVDAAQHPANPA